MSLLKNSCILLSLMLIPMLGYGQQKLENEVRISRSEVPKIALEFIDTAPFKKKVRWYKEYFLGGTSVEAKTRFNGKRYSIEFDVDGNLEDVEIDHPWKQAPEPVRQRMEDYLEEQFERYSLDKLQFQYSGATHQVFEWLHGRLAASTLQLRYEVVIHTKVKGRFKRFEVLFDDNGNYIKSAEFIPKNVDNIEY
ncbi:hypothetical protein [Gilvibacter sp.]|uniref:hypothetical protein n=1 Tax=Gilvibacter sp. TaxID=2729997 RepID=UPI003F49FDCC